MKRNIAKPHRIDGLSLVAGLFFLASAGWWLVSRTVHLRLPAFDWLFALALIAVGTLGLVAAVRQGRSRDKQPEPPVED